MALSKKKRFEVDVARDIEAGVDINKMRRALAVWFRAPTSAEAIACELVMLHAMAPIRRTPSKSRSTPSKLRRAVLAERQGPGCWRCGEETEYGLEVDHLLPVTHGGSSKEWNLLLLCPRCNNQKGQALHAWALLLMLEQLEASLA